MPKKGGGPIVIAVTGTPGAGKTTFAESLSKETGMRSVEVNDVVEEKKLFDGVDDNGSRIVKMQKLRMALEEIIKNEDAKGIILVGHLLADLNLDYDIAAVVRCNLKTLIERMEGRRYKKEKLKENLVSESIDYCGVQAAQRSKESYEVESEEQKKLLAGYIKERLGEKSPEKPSFPEINKLSELLELVYEGNSYGF
jgi:adenylate kinase